MICISHLQLDVLLFIGSFLLTYFILDVRATFRGRQ